MKRLLKFALTLVGMLLLATAFQAPQKASAVALSWKKDHWVTLTKNVTVYKNRNTDPLAYSYTVAKYTAKAGSHYKLSHWGTNYSWALQSGKFNTGAKYTYAIDKAYNDGSWFKMGIHKLKSSAKAFHGYRIERKNANNGNTFYDKDSHCVLSTYAPTQKSKVIFYYGSKVYPTRHEWDKIVGNYFTPYIYKNGYWNKGKTEYVPD